MPWGQLKDDFGNTSGHIWNNLRTSWGQLGDFSGTTWDYLGSCCWRLHGDYLYNILRPTWWRIWDYFRTHWWQLGDFSGTTWDHLGSYWWIHVTYLWNILGATWGQLDDTLDYLGLTFGLVGIIVKPTKSRLLAQKVLLDYVRPMITIQSIQPNPIPSIHK